MKVYIVCGDHYNAPTPNRVFSTMERAQAYAGQYDYILVFEVDADQPGEVNG